MTLAFLNLTWPTFANGLALGGVYALMAVGIIVSTIGFVNSGILSAPRMLQAMSADGLFFRFASRLHPRYHTPAGGIAIQAVWAVALALSFTAWPSLGKPKFGGSFAGGAGEAPGGA